MALRTKAKSMPWVRVVALGALLLTSLGGMIGPIAPGVVASASDCGDGQTWDDTQQLCVATTPASAGADDGQSVPDAAATPTVVQGIVAGDNGTGRGSIRIELSLCAQGFDPAADPGADLSRVCNQDYSFVRYPITFTAFGTTHDTAIVGVTDTFFGWVKWDDNLGPDTYRVEATLPAGISTVLFEYCGDGGTVQDGKLTFLAPVTAGGLFACGLDAVRDPSVPTPTRAPNTGSSSLTIASAVCPAGFAPDPSATNPIASCPGAAAGIAYNLSGPDGAASPLSVGGTDTLTIRANPGVYHVTFSLPDPIASVAGVRCTVYDLTESHWVEDAVLAPVTTGRDVALDIDVPGAMLWSCSVAVVPVAAASTSMPTATSASTSNATMTVTPLPTATSEVAGQPDQPDQQGQTGAMQGGPDAQTSGQAGTQPSGAMSGGPDAHSAESGSGSDLAATVSAADDSTGGGAVNAGAGGPSTIYLFLFQCPSDDVWDAKDPNAGLACSDQPDGVTFTITGKATGATDTQKTGESVPGGVVFEGITADTYDIAVTLPKGQHIEVRPCDVTGMTDGSVKTPMQLTVSETGTSFIALPADTMYACNWYLVPDASASRSPSAPVLAHGRLVANAWLPRTGGRTL